MNRASRASELKDAVATAEAIFSLGLSEARAIASSIEGETRIKFARGLCATILNYAWTHRIKATQTAEIRPPPCSILSKHPGLVKRIGDAFMAIPLPQSGFLIGQLYTTLLTDQFRKSLGAFYTPPNLVERLLDLVDEAGFDWTKGRVLDPACGGAAFLASVAPRLVRTSKFDTPESILADIEARLIGIELDPFAAWMSMVLLDLALADLSRAAGRPIKNLVLHADALQTNVDELGLFDLIVGNPPYGKVTLTSFQRRRYQGSLFGHANLYGLFTDLAVQMTRANGIVAFVTPTSFLGGEYFKNLRKLLERHAPLRRAEFLTDREGVFQDVLQETMLAVFRRQNEPKQGIAEVAVVQAEDSFERLAVHDLGGFAIKGLEGKPWFLPRSSQQKSLIETLDAMPARLRDYGFAVSTGQLVWNRHKDQLRKQYKTDYLPIVWAESVTPDGRFHFQSTRRMHPYIDVGKGQNFLVNQEPCILVQRTTAKEQRRRLIAAVIPNSFVLQYPGFVVENHLNMVYSVNGKSTVGLRTIAALLNSTSLDQAFRCINGSVAVSAYELNSLPLPSPEQMLSLQELVLSGASSHEIEELVQSFYSEKPTTYAVTPTRTTSNHRKMAA